jgi:hypothetical protein
MPVVRYHHHRVWEAVAAVLGQVQAGGNAQLGRQRLDEHGHQVAGYNKPQQRVAELGAALDVGGKVTGVDVGHAGDKGRPQEGQQPGQAAFFAAPGTFSAAV